MKSWTERILVFVRGYKLKDTWNKEEFGTIFKLLSNKGFIEKTKSKKSGKVRLTVVFFVNADGQKVDEPAII